MPDLVISDLVVEFESGGYPIRPLDGLSVTVPDGSLAVLLGPSGCGKTTLLSCLGGILTPTSGSIRFGEREISALSPGQLSSYRQTDVGIVFQAFNLIPSLSAVENVIAPMRAAKVPKHAARERAEELVRRVGLEDRMDHRSTKLSGGQQQRISLARAIAQDPPLVIADEPTASLDYIQVEAVLRILRELAEPGRVVIVATHDDRLIPLADQLIEMVPQFREDGAPVIHDDLEDGEELFAQGSRGSRIYIVESGRVEIIRTRADETEELLATLGAGEHFGEMGPLFGIERSAGARAKGTTRVAGYTTEQFRKQVGAGRLVDLIRAMPGVD